MKPAVHYIPEGFHTITPLLIIRGAEKAIAFYQAAFGAVEKNRLTMPNGKIAYAELRIAGAPIMLGDEFVEMQILSPESLKGSPVVVHIYTPDVDALVNQAVASGATIVRPVADQFFGERVGRIMDPFGHSWNIAARTEALSTAEIHARFEKFFAQKKS